MFHLNCFLTIEEYSQSTDSFTLLLRTATEPNASHGKAQMSDISQTNAKLACTCISMYICISMNAFTIHINVHMHTHLHIHTHLHTYKSNVISVCMYVCIVFLPIVYITLHSRNFQRVYIRAWVVKSTARATS